MTAGMVFGNLSTLALIYSILLTRFSLIDLFPAQAIGKLRRERPSSLHLPNLDFLARFFARFLQPIEKFKARGGTPQLHCHMITAGSS